MQHLRFLLLPALARLCYANVHGVICKQNHFELPSNLQDCNIIKGGLIVDDYLGVFSLPNLRMVDSISFQSSNITEISLPNLVTATQFLTFWDLPQLTEIWLPSLVSGRPAILLAWLPQLMSFNMPKLVASSGIKIKSTPSLKEIHLPSLAKIKDENFSGYLAMENGAESLSLPSLLEVDGTFNVTGRIDSIRLPHTPKALHDMFVSSSGTLNCIALGETWRNTEQAMGEFRCDSRNSISRGTRDLMPTDNPPNRKESIVKMLITAAIAIFALVAFLSGSRWDLWFILSMYVGLWSLLGSHLDIRWGWLAPLLYT